MSSRWKWREHQPARTLSNRAIVLGAVVVLGIAVASGTVLWCLYGGADPRVQLDAIRTASAITVAAGGAAALLLAARRQQSTERTLEHERENAAEQRITELYTRAVDQLGAEDAPVRLGGLHALERVAQNNPTQRQTIVDVICSYLRMPYTSPPGWWPPSPHQMTHRPHIHGGSYRRNLGSRQRRHRAFTDRPPASSTPTLRYQQAQEERQVRLTAQDILTRNLLRTSPPNQPRDFPTAPPPWPGMRLNLAGAHLIDFTMSCCQADQVNFTGAHFTGDASFYGVWFTGDSVFHESRFTGNATFMGARFASDAGFGSAQFTSSSFYCAQFGGVPFFFNAHFTHTADFGKARFPISNVDEYCFNGTKFTGGVRFDDARVPLDTKNWLPGWTTRPARSDEDEDPDHLYLVQDVPQ